MARRRRKTRLRRFRISGRHKLSGFVRKRRRTFTLKRRSPFKRRLRGFRINPGVAEYLMNPKRRRRGSRRSHRGYRSNPASGIVNSMKGVMDFGFIKHGAVATGGAVSTIVVGNLARGYLLPYLPAMLSTGYGATVTTAAIRAAASWALDTYVVGLLTKDKQAFRVGSAIGIIGSALLELLGTNLIIGAGDTAQTYDKFVPAALSGYVRAPGMVAAYTPKSVLALGGGRGIGDIKGIGSKGHDRLYNR